MRQARKTGLLIFIIGFIIAVSVMAGHAGSGAKYVGAGKCKLCHKKQYKSWEQTKMAAAYELLKPGNRAEAKKKAGLNPQTDFSNDPKCVKCHTVGFGSPGGFENFSKTPKMVGVQCEDCHGPGDKYIDIMMKEDGYSRNEALKQGLILPTEAVCKKCHTAEENPFHKPFNYAEALKKGVHERTPK